MPSSKLTQATLCSGMVEAIHPGDYYFGKVEVAPDMKCDFLYFCCPCGNGEIAGIPLYKEGEQKPSSTAWLWNGSTEKPTLQPSILRRGGCNWHGWLTDGVFREC